MNIYLKKKKRGQPEILSDGKYLLGPDEVFFFFVVYHFMQFDDPHIVMNPTLFIIVSL